LGGFAGSSRKPKGNSSAVAGVVMTSNVKKYALKQGFYVIEPSGGEPSLASARSAEGSGETFNIIPPSGKPKEW